MAGLHELGFDLLYVIFSHLQSDKEQLCHLALLCRPFYDVAQRFIVRDAKINHSLRGSRSQLFLRTLTERPDLIPNVHRLEFDLLREDIHWPEEQQNINKITRLVTNLREFCYLSRDYKAWHYSVPFPLKWEREHAHNQIRRVDWHHNMAPHELQKCMELPQIESILCRELHDTSSGRRTSFNLPAHKRKTSSLAELQVGSPFQLAFDSLQILLQLPRCLKRLSLLSPDTHGEVLLPSAVVRLVEPLQDSLEELNIGGDRGRILHTGQRLDLSPFSSLRKLSLPFPFVFGQGATASNRADRLFPPGLRSLTMSFITSSSPTIREFTEQNFKNLSTWLNDHVKQEDVPLRMPMLTEVTLQESHAISYYPDLDGRVVGREFECLISKKAGSSRLTIRVCRK